jgi:flagellar secretion chaperone FliS
MSDANRAEGLRVRYLTEAIETSTPVGRLTMLWDALEMDLAKADRAFEARDIKGTSDALIHAQDILVVLRDTIDVSVWEAGARLQLLYHHFWAELVKANLDKDRDRAAEVATQVSRLAAAWRAAAVTVEGGSTGVTPVAGAAAR